MTRRLRDTGTVWTSGVSLSMVVKKKKGGGGGGGEREREGEMNKKH